MQISGQLHVSAALPQEIAIVSNYKKVWMGSRASLDAVKIGFYLNLPLNYYTRLWPVSNFAGKALLSFPNSELLVTVVSFLNIFTCFLLILMC
jgi:hypothetical protein